MNRLMTIAGAAGLACLLLAGAIFALLTPLSGRVPASVVDAQTPAGSEPAIVVVTEGSASAQPDQAVVSVGVQVTQPTATAALAESNAKTEAVLAKLAELGVPRANIQTSGISLFPVQDAPTRPGAEPPVVGFRASNNVTVLLTDLSRVGAILDAVVGAGANQLQGVRFTIADPSALQRQAMDEAVKKSRSQADAIAAGLGLKAGRVL
ncbi:MAG: SIMPL domain-containing protein, partial [Chloroflexi bacterium]|nr:SIMPL domain-containing protein [Chloroflexota bacterium]